MKHKTGDLFDTTARYIAHGVNVDGVMGAGIAKRFRSEFPEMYIDYTYLCKDKELVPGSLFASSQTFRGRRIIVANLATQDRPGRNANHAWLVDSVLELVKFADQEAVFDTYGRLIAIPEIGCGIGGLHWPCVERLLLAIETLYPKIEFEVWHYDGVKL